MPLFCDSAGAALDAVAAPGAVPGSDVNPSAAQPIVLRQVNGYSLLLAHAPEATQAHFRAIVPTGALFDDPVKHAGRSHLWEHVIHLGSVGYPTPGAFSAAMSRAGAQSNAYTGANRIVYFANAPYSQWTIAAQALGDLLTRPLFAAQTFPPERKVVKEEVLSYQGRDLDALDAMLNLWLRPDGHPLRMFDGGTQAQLDAMGMADLKELYFSDYRPGNVLLVLAGDFSRPEMNVDLALAAIGNSFAPATVPEEFAGLRPSREKTFPAMLPWSERPGAPFAIEVESREGQRLLELDFDVDSEWLDAHSAAASLLLDYLRMRNPNSLFAPLRENGLAFSPRVQSTRLTNRTIVKIVCELSPAGYERRHEVVERLFAGLGGIAAGRLDPDLVAFLRSRLQIRLAKSVRRSGSAAAEVVGAEFVDGKSPAEIAAQGFDLGIDSVTGFELAEAAQRMFSPEFAMLATVAPEAASAPFPATDAIFARGVRPVADAGILQAWREASATGSFRGQKPNLALEIGAVPGLQPLSRPKAGEPGASEQAPPAEILKGIGVDRVSARRLPGSPTSVVRAHLRLSPSRLTTSSLTIDAWIETFRQKHAEQLDYIASTGHDLVFNQQRADFVIHASGDPSGAFSALAWFARAFAEHQPTEREIHAALDREEAGARKGEGAFPALQALDIGHQTLARAGGRPVDGVRWLKRAERDRPGTVAEIVRQAFARVDVAAALVGDWDESQARVLLTVLRATWPRALTTAQRQAAASPGVQVGATVEYAGRMRGNREDGDFAQSRFFELTGLDHANPLDAARSALLADLMRQRVFAVNRTQKGLGYVHGAHLFRGAEITLGFYGEARGTAEEQAEIARGWANAIAWTQAISLELRAAFERSREGLLARLQEKKGPAEAAVADLDALGRGAELDFNAKLVEAMRVLTLEDVVRTAQNRLGPDRPYLDVRLFGGTPGGRLARACSGFFVAEAGAASAGGPASKASSISGARAALRARR